LNAYLERTGDYDGLGVLPFYVMYRAMVRAKVARFRMRQLASPEEREKYRQSFRGRCGPFEPPDATPAA
jgi:aminoglycoside phosphotransferase family enzyme